MPHTTSKNQITSPSDNKAKSMARDDSMHWYIPNTASDGVFWIDGVFRSDLWP
jgi:hypothetical protein